MLVEVDFPGSIRQLIYRFRGSNYSEKPKRTYIVRYELDTDSGITYAVLKRRSYFTHILVFAATVCVAYMTCSINQPQVLIGIHDKAYGHDQSIELNITNFDSNSYDISARLMYYDMQLTDNILLSPGVSVGNVRSDRLDLLSSGLYYCRLEYEVIGDELHYGFSKEVQLVVE